MLFILVILSLISWGSFSLMVRAQARGEHHPFVRARVRRRRQRRSAAAMASAEQWPDRRTDHGPRDAIHRGDDAGAARNVGSLARASAASQVEALQLVLDAETTSERDRLGRWVPSLATIGSVSPLIGLLGTVLGVIDAFVGIAAKGSGNIGAVAPGVAEALIATAAALSVAIPAVFAYNIFAVASQQDRRRARELRLGADRADGARGTDLVARRGRGRERLALNAEINVVSLIDVMMLLMIIFMITAPMMQGGVDIALPKAEARPLESKSGLTVTVDRAARSSSTRRG